MSKNENLNKVLKKNQQKSDCDENALKNNFGYIFL